MAVAAASAAAAVVAVSGGGGGGCGLTAGNNAGIWRLPGRVLELVFSYLELRELRSCALVCKVWYRVLHGDENSEVWRSLAARSLAEEALRTDILCNVPTYKGKVRPGRDSERGRRFSRGGSQEMRRIRGSISPHTPAPILCSFHT